jgi:hypothetical protein
MNDKKLDRLPEALKSGKVVVPSFKHEEFTQDQINDFMQRIFGMPWALISERTTVSEFCERPWPLESEPKPDYWVTLDEAYERIYAVYGVRLSANTHPHLLDALRAAGVGAARN